MFVKSLLKYLFTWWNGNTVGTKLYTFLKGKKVGEDYLGNFTTKVKTKRIVGAFIVISPMHQE